jgi:hypothetical protein
MIASRHECIIIGGASSSSTDDVSSIRNNVIGSTVNVKNMSIMEVSSLGNRSGVIDHIGAVNPSLYDSLTVIGKSLGGKRLMQAYDKLKKSVDLFKRVSLVFIDAHSPFPNYYGKYRGMEIDTASSVLYTGFGVKTWNVYQHNSKPYGCSVNATGEIKSTRVCDKNVDHFNIVNTVDVMRAISEAMNWATLGM